SHDLSSRAYYAVELLALHGFDGIATPSGLVAATLKRAGLSAKKIVTIGNGVDVARFSSGKPILRQEVGKRHLVGIVARLVPEKGGDTMLRAASIVLREFPDTAFVFVGSGPSRNEWERLAGELGIAGNVVFAGVRDDMPDVYASLDLMVLPSLREAMP